MKVVYFAHPYGGELENYGKSCGLAAILSDKYPNYHIFNATRHFSQFKGRMNEGEIMNRCIDMVGRCDTLWLAPDWRESSGCTLEHFEATKLGLPIRYLTKDDFKADAEVVEEESFKISLESLNSPIRIPGTTKPNLNAADVVDNGLRIKTDNAADVVGDGLQIKIDPDVEIAITGSSVHVRRAK